MKTRKLTEVPKSEFSWESNLIAEIDEELKRVPGSQIKRFIEEETARAEEAEKTLAASLAAETGRATDAEKVLTEDLAKEMNRAETKESELFGSIQAEAVRALQEESTLSEKLNIEISRAEQEESLLNAALEGETARAEEAEKDISDKLEGEINRAIQAESLIDAAVKSEVARAKDSEKTLTDNLSAETARAKAAEKTNADNLTTESSRAKAKETELQTSIQTEAGRATAAEESIQNTINTNKPNWDDKYTKNEVDNKFSALETAIDWKEAVGTYDDLVAAYPDPEDGWTVNVKDTDYTYRWNGAEWIAISANAIPKATQSLDGLLSREDKTAYDEAYSKRHTHSNQTTLDKLTEALLTNWTDAYNKRHEHGNKSVIDKITQTLLDNWTAAYTHISDAVKHITAAERTDWNDANNKKHTHSNQSVLDSITQALLDRWNTVGEKVDKVTGKGLSANDYTTAEKNKLAGIAAGAEVNVQPDWSEADTASDAYIKNKPASMPAKGGESDTTVKLKTARTINGVAFDGSKNITIEANTPIKQLTGGSLDDVKTFGDYYAGGGNSVTGKPEGVDHFGLRVLRVASGYIGQELDVSGRKWTRMYNSGTSAWSSWLEFFTEGHKPAWSDITGKPSTFTPAVHSHTKSQITDMPTKVSQFTNDAGYLTQADVDTTQNHTHNNKSVLDKITQVLVDQWNSALTALPAHTHTKSQITDFPSALKNPAALTVSLNGTSQGAYDGSATKAFNITASSVGAAASGHNHDSTYVKNTSRTLTLTAAGWSEAYPYTQTITVSGISANDDIKVLGVYVPADAALDQVKAWNKAAGCLMYNPDGVAEGKITFKAYKKPTVDFQIITEGG